MVKKTKILGIKIDNLTVKQVFQRIDDFLKDGRQRYIVTPNPEFLVRAQKDKEFRQILNQADLAVSDGTGVLFASWFLNQPLKQRITGTDLMEMICQRAPFKDWSIFLLGGRKMVSEKAAENLKKKYPGLKIEPIDDSALDNPNIIPSTVSEKSSIDRTNILFVALGTPKQEKWIFKNLKEVKPIKLVIGVGGAFDFLAGRISRAPRILRRVGLEWLWRLACQPRRIKRIFKAVIIFPWLIIREAMR